MEAALKAGYRHIDCAHIYRNEPEIGEALQKCFKDGVCKREDIFITSKLWYVYWLHALYQGCIEPPKVARGHATHIDGIVLNVTTL